jgi:hypothetical protein
VRSHSAGSQSQQTFHPVIGIPGWFLLISLKLSSSISKGWGFLDLITFENIIGMKPNSQECKRKTHCCYHSGGTYRASPQQTYLAFARLYRMNDRHNRTEGKHECTHLAAQSVLEELRSQPHSSLHTCYLAISSKGSWHTLRNRISLLFPDSPKGNRFGTCNKHPRDKE